MGALRYYPVNLDIRGRKVVVVGGGAVAARRVRGLLAAGADLTIIAPHLDSRLQNWVRKKAIRWLKRRYRQGDLAKAALALGATGDFSVDHRMVAEARGRGILINIADQPALCGFTIPARVGRGDFLITISTGGRSPALAKLVRRRLEKEFGPEYGEITRLLSRLRRVKKEPGTGKK